jgi:UrcA family protein
VTYGDLDLASSAGQGRLQQRIVIAAHSVCDPGNLSDMTMTKIVLACRSDAIGGAQPAFQTAVAAAEHRGTVDVLDGASLVVTRK